MADRKRPLHASHTATELEYELKDLFLKVYTDSFSATADDINVYGAAHLGSFGLVERSIDADGLAVLRETTEDRIRFLYKAWRHRNPERGLRFLRLYLLALFGDSYVVSQMWQPKNQTYPNGVRSQDEITSSGLSESDFFLTSRVRVDIDADQVPAKVLASMRSAVAARILLHVRVSRVLGAGVRAAGVGYVVNVMRLGVPGEGGGPVTVSRFVVTEANDQIIAEQDDSLITEGPDIVEPVLWELQGGGLLTLQDGSPIQLMG